MLIEIKVPVLAESISEATIASWNKKAGEFVSKNESLVDMETDKVMLEIVAPNDGILKEIKKEEGTNVASDEVIAVLDTDAKAFSSNSVSNSISSTGKTNDTPLMTAVSTTTNVGLSDLSPSVRKLVAEHQLDPHRIKGTGKNGRIVKSDVLGYLDHMAVAQSNIAQTILSQTDKATQTSAAHEPLSVTKPSVTSLPPLADETRREKRVPMSRLRARVAERLKEAQNTAAILTTFNEVNMKSVMDLRNKYKENFLDRHETKLGFMSFFTKAVVEALKQLPIINASTEDDDIIYHGYYDIGIAVGSPRGLVVPILRNVDEMSFADIEIAIRSYGEKAREGKLSLEDLTGGTFSISNGGVYGSMLSTPILNPPQSAILGMHNIVERPVVEDGEIVIRPMMYVALSYDHRIIDGHDAVLFLVAVKQAIEDPTRMLLAI
ncbi:MAG: 2-oxoglutarate dehydrogenase complex dihydrolipoyllysine-residue succinyltransferase [Gammaproteobacteria bacterium]|nr:2-oxoglutarate dehydrogenase complex dihydrolipoyllysine-residue succinyltransferase [Gammaproteobacteria bacterium]